VWAQVVIADQTQKAFSEFGAVSPDKPVLMMADATGTIRYAGTATGFIAPMLLAKFSKGDLISLAAPEEIKETVVKPADSNSLPVASLPVADSNSVSKAAPAAQTPAPKPAQQAAQPQSKFRQLSEEDAIMAERKVAVTRDLYMNIGKKPGLTYTQGVKLCREIMKDYAGSEYADQARDLLRKVPENQRTRYGITDEELGL
jgi:hypothetical protein